MVDQTSTKREIGGPEQFQHLNDDELAKVEMEYEGNTVPFFVILIWIGMIIGVITYLVVFAYPDAVDWLK